MGKGKQEDWQQVCAALPGDFVQHKMYESSCLLLHSAPCIVALSLRLTRCLVIEFWSMMYTCLRHWHQSLPQTRLGGRKCYACGLNHSRNFLGFLPQCLLTKATYQKRTPALLAERMVSNRANHKVNSGRAGSQANSHRASSHRASSRRARSREGPRSHANRSSGARVARMSNVGRCKHKH